MMKSSKMMIAALAVFVAGIFYSANAQVNTDVYLSVLGGNVTIGTTGAFNFGTFGVASTAVVTGRQFTGNDYFWIDDMKGSNSGWYTTISVTDLTGTNGTIGSGNIAMKVTTTGTTLITGTANANVVVANTLINYTSLNSPITFLQRTAGANLGKLGRYATFPWLQVTIPAYQAVGSYHATITYTLYDLG